MSEAQRYFEDFVFFETGKKARSTLRKALKLGNKLKPIVYDVEATGVNPWEHHTYLFSHKTGEAKRVKGARVFSVQFGIQLKDGLHCVFIYADDLYSMRLARELLKRPVRKIGHNIKYDIQISRESGIEINVDDIFDTLTATRLTHDRLFKHDLKFLGNYFSGKSGVDSDLWESGVKNWLRNTRAAFTRSITKKLSQGEELEPHEKDGAQAYINYSFVPPDLMIPYGLKDIWYCYLVYSLVVDEIESDYAAIFEVETKLIHLALKMESYGVMVDRLACKWAVSELTRLQKLADTAISRVASKHKIAGLTSNTHDKIKKLLLELGVSKEDMVNEKGKYSSDAYVMDRLVVKYPNLTFVQDLLNSRTFSKLRGTYFENILSHSIGTSVVHCNIKCSDTATGRFAVSDPSLQNIPRPTTKAIETVPTVRGVFVPRPGMVNAYFDYSQIEMVVFALFSQEPGMLNRIAKGEDFHTGTAKLMFGERKYEDNPKRYRQMAKAINFGIIYGMGIKKLAATLGISYEAARQLMDDYKHKFPGVNRLLRKCQKEIATKGYVEDMFGRRYHIPIEKSYIAVNSLVQGASANLLKFAMLQTENLIKALDMEKLIHLLLVIHDEQDVEIHEDALWTIPIIKLAMEEVTPIKYYGVNPKVEVEISDVAWDKKQPLEMDSETIKEAREEFYAVYDQVVIQYNCEHVDWFLNDAT